MLLPEWSTAVLFCLVIVVHESLVCPEQLNCLLFFRKILQVIQALVDLNHFQQWLYDFEIHLFTQRTTEGVICNYYRMFKRSLMLQKKKQCIKGGENFWTEWRCVIFFILPKYHIFLFCTARSWRCFPENKIRYIYPDLQIQKVFTPRPLMHNFSFWSISESLNLL